MEWTPAFRLGVSQFESRGARIVFNLTSARRRFKLF